MNTIASAFPVLAPDRRIAIAVELCRRDPNGIGAANESLVLRVANARMGHIDLDNEHEWTAAAYELEAALDRWARRFGRTILSPTMLTPTELAAIDAKTAKEVAR